MAWLKEGSAVVMTTGLDVPLKNQRNDMVGFDQWQKVIIGVAAAQLLFPARYCPDYPYQDRRIFHIALNELDRRIPIKDESCF